MDGRRSWAFERGVLWARTATGLPTTPIVPRIAAQFGEVRPDDLPRLDLAGLPEPGLVQHRLANGRRLFAGWVDGRLATVAWVSLRPEWVGELERTFTLAADEAYIWDCVTLPAYRRQRLYSALLSYVLLALPAEGVERIWIGASLTNQPSQRGMATAGFQPIVSVVYWRLLAVRCLWITRAPGAPTALTAAARRLLTPRHERAFGPLTVGLGRQTPSPASSV